MHWKWGGRQCTEIWMKFTEALSVLGGDTPTAFYLVLGDAVALWEGHWFPRGRIFFDAAGVDFYSFITEQSVQHRRGQHCTLKGVGGTGLFCRWQPTTPTDKFKSAPFALQPLFFLHLKDDLGVFVALHTFILILNWSAIWGCDRTEHCSHKYC